MSGKFGGLAAQVDEPFRVYLIDPDTDEVIVDNTEGKNKSYIDVYSQNSEMGQQIDKENRKKTNQRLASGRREAVISEDSLANSQAKLARLTKAWYLVDPVTHEPIDVKCNADNALELYSDRHTFHIYQQVFTASAEVTNFINRSSKKPSTSPSGTSGSTENETTAQPNVTT
jgi:hypothetical protein